MEKDYFTARVPTAVISIFRQAQAREGVKHGWMFFIKILEFYLNKNHRDLFRELQSLGEL